MPRGSFGGGRQRIHCSGVTTPEQCKAPFFLLRLRSPQKAKHTAKAHKMQGQGKCYAPLHCVSFCGVWVAFFPHRSTAIIVLWWGRGCVVAVFPCRKTTSGGEGSPNRTRRLGSFLSLSPPDVSLSESYFIKSSEPLQGQGKSF